MSDIKDMVMEMKKAMEFGRSCLFPAYLEIQYITMHTGVLFEDIDENLRILKKVMNKSEKKRSIVSRNTIRSSCACIDGFSYVLKNALKSTLDKSSPKTFSSKQLIYIKDSFTNGSGADNFKASLKCFARKYGIDVSNVFGSGEFDKLRKLFEIRNRLMHPKNKNDFSISREETMLLLDAIIWFVSSHDRVFKEIFKKITTQADEVFLK
ncbi:hypothetical protein EEAAV_26355 (plasmid) [Rahnella aceris]